MIPVSMDFLETLAYQTGATILRTAARCTLRVGGRTYTAPLTGSETENTLCTCTIYKPLPVNYVHSIFCPAKRQEENR